MYPRLFNVLVFKNWVNFNYIKNYIACHLLLYQKIVYLYQFASSHFLPQVCASKFLPRLCPKYTLSVFSLLKLCFKSFFSSTVPQVCPSCVPTVFAQSVPASVTQVTLCSKCAPILQLTILPQLCPKCAQLDYQIAQTEVPYSKTHSTSSC